MAKGCMVGLSCAGICNGNRLCCKYNAKKGFELQDVKLIGVFK